MKLNPNITNSDERLLLVNEILKLEHNYSISELSNYLVYGNNKDILKNTRLSKIQSKEVEYSDEKPNYKLSKKYKIKIGKEIGLTSFYAFEITEKPQDKYRKQLLAKIKKELILDALYCKHRHIIYFKKLSEESTENNLDWVDYNNPKHIKALLKLRTTKYDESWFSCISQDLNSAISKLSEIEIKILTLYKNEFTLREISELVNLHFTTVDERINNSIKKIIKILGEKNDK